MSATFKKLLILGLDALPWRVLSPVIAAGAAPRLKALIEHGCSGVLHSTIPHQTPAAWTTFMTGVRPGTHGIINWQHYDARKNALTLNNVERFAGKTIYERFSEAGFKVGVVMQPVTYPPFKVNGFLLSGFDSPGIDSPFAYPRELEKEILEICPRHGENIGVDESWEVARHDSDDEAFAQNIGLLSERVRRVTQLAIELNKRHPTDVLDFFRTLDAACGELIDTFGNAHESLTLVLSDHGQRPDARRVRLNSILMELGFLAPASGLGLLKDGLRRVTNKLHQNDEQGLGVPIDWEKTQAFMPFQSCTGFVYVNLEGRQPHGSVKPEDFIRVRDAVIEGLRNYRDPLLQAGSLHHKQTGSLHHNFGQSFFEQVGAMDETQGWRKELLLPDIFVQPAPGVEFVRRAKRGENSYPTKRPYAGLHDPEGLYILEGSGVKRARDLSGSILDLAPTLLAALGQAIPSYMEGKVLAECFDAALPVKSIPFPWDAKEPGQAYSAEDAAAVEKRLGDLGYLD